MARSRHPSIRSPGKPSRSWRWLALMVGGMIGPVTLLLLTAADRIPADPPAQPPVGLAEDQHLDKTPARTTKGLDLTKMGWSYDCMECHKSLEAKWHYDRPLVEHENIRLNHGNNRFCLNCHHPKNRNAFVDYDGSVIEEENVVQLCARCHGTTHRDFQAGVHGRQNGHWNEELGPQTQLRCIQCHDPHEPAFQPMTALPAPEYPKRAAGGGHNTKSDH